MAVEVTTILVRILTIASVTVEATTILITILTIASVTVEATTILVTILTIASGAENRLSTVQLESRKARV